ncbi:hypothetical protein ASG81_19525 [Paenibacillus sp. Soil522]|nr:hypothetical protein ASG81_19525 [Paenibacillus sp. Soil522]
MGEVECQIDLTERKTIEELEKRAEQKVAAIMLRTIHKVQKSLKVDIFGFGEESCFDCSCQFSKDGFKPAWT